MHDLVTISVPTCRRPSLLLHALHSCFLQDYRPLEVDVSDNSATDDTGQIVRGLVPPPGINLRYWRNQPATDLPRNMDKLFAEARGRRLVLMNDDDVLLPGAVTAMNAAFALADDVVCSYGTLQRISPSGEYDAAETEAHNAYANRTSEQSGLRRDLLVCAFWRQLPPVGFMLDTETARRVGYGDATRIGYAFDTEFGIRLALACRGGGAFAFIDRPTAQYRLPSPDGLTRTARTDLCWKLWDLAAGMGGLSPEEVLARDWLLSRLAHCAVVEHALERRRGAALRVLFSRQYPRGESALKFAYALGLVALPKLTRAVRVYSGRQIEVAPRNPPIPHNVVAAPAEVRA